jgi:hypothetical protein
MRRHHMSNTSAQPVVDLAAEAIGDDYDGEPEQDLPLEEDQS